LGSDENFHDHKRLGGFFVLLLWFLIVALYATWAFRAPVVFNDPRVNLLISLVFRFGMSMVVTYIAARSFLLTGSSNLFLLGAGALAFGLSGLAGNTTAFVGGTTETVIAVNNIGALLSSALFFTGSVLTMRGKGPPQARASLVPGYLTLEFLGVIAFMALLVSLSLRGALPAFLTGQGSRTQLNETVLFLTVALFAASSIIFARYYSRSRSSIIYWYFLALALLATSSASFFLSRIPGDLISWAGRIATCLGSIYLFIAVLTAVAFRSAKTRRS